MHIIGSQICSVPDCFLGLLEVHPRTLSHAFLQEENVLQQPQIWCDALSLGSESNFDHKLVVVHIRTMW